MSVLLAFLLAFSFLLGAFSSIMETKGNRSWVLAVRDRLVDYIPSLPFTMDETLKSLLGASPTFPNSIDSLRYRLSTFQRFDEPGQYHLALDKNGSLYALNRLNGNFFSFTKGQLSDGYELPNLSEAIAGIQKDLAQPVLYTDLHFANQQFFIFVVVVTPDQSNECGIAYSFRLDGKKVLNIRRIFSTPCIQDRLNTAMWGGRFSNSKTTLYLSIGEQRYDRSGFPKETYVANRERENKESVFGCVLESIFPVTDFTRFSCGHRNTQGLFYSDADGHLYESEHGPSGGDEINILKRGHYYGWPQVSLGGAYGWPLEGPESGRDPFLDKPGSISGYEKSLRNRGFYRGTHEGFEPPIASWIPSVGASALVQVPRGSSLRDWAGDLLLGTMTEKAIRRVRLSGTRLILDEKIEIRFRIRDMVLDQNNTIYISTDEYQLVALKFEAKNS
jgi:glucose/arabinose dehydrogenase